MPIYVLTATDGSGETLDIHSTVNDRPEYGEKRVIDGREWERLVSVQRQDIMVADDINFAAVSLPIHDKDFPRVNEHGEGVFLSRREIQNYVDKKRAQGKELVYDRYGIK